MDAWEVFLRSSSSLNVSFGGVVGLNLPAVEAVARAMGVEWTEDLMDRILILESLLVAHCNKESKDKKPASPRKK